MIKTYIIQTCHNKFPTTEEGWDAVVTDVINVNPDKIIVFTSTEVAIENHFGPFFDKIQSYLEQTGKMVNVITPHIENTIVRPNIITERTFGNIQAVFGSFLQNTGKIARYDLGSRIAPDHFGHTPINRVYTCYNVRSSEHRGMMVDYLAKENLLSKGIVTYHQPDYYEWKWHDGSKLLDEENYSKDSMEHFRTPKSFFNGFFDIVTETWFEPGKQHITEKTLRSIAFFKPFLVLGSPGFHLEYLTNYIGLKMYDEIFDYSFDYEESLETRVQGIIKNIKTLENMSTSELEQTYRTIIPKLIFNKSKIVEILYDKNKIVPKAFQFLLNNDEVKLYGMYENYFFDFIYHLGWIKKKLI